MLWKTFDKANWKPKLIAIVRFIPVDVEGKFDHLVAKRLKQAGKISFLDVGLVWIIHKAPKVRQVYDVERQRTTIQTEGPITLQDIGCLLYTSPSPRDRG